MTGKAARRAGWILGPIPGAALIAGVVRLRARQNSADAHAPAEVGFMRALHAALRRDLSRLHGAAAELATIGTPRTVLAGWDAFRAQLDNHHSAEDDDLWPVLRRLTEMPSARLVYRRVLRPRYDAQRRWQIPQSADR